MDPVLAGGLAGAAGGIGASLIGASSARDATEASMREANRNRQFQLEMSTSAHQRQVADLKAAGLNPLLSAGGGGGAPMASGSTGSAESFAPENPLSGVMTAAKEYQALKLATQKQGQEIRNLKEGEKLTASQKAKTDMETQVMKKGLPEADLKNKIYDSLKEGYKNIKQKINEANEVNSSMMRQK